MSRSNRAIFAGVLVATVATVWLASRQKQAPSMNHKYDDASKAKSYDDDRPELPRPEDIPWEIGSWIEATLWRSGLWSMRDSFLSEDPTARTRLRKGGTPDRIEWGIDFSDLPVSALGTGSDPDWEERNVHVDLKGSRVCGEDKKSVSPTMASRIMGLEDGRCSPADDHALALDWFKDNFRRAPGPTEISGPPNSRPTTIRIACSSGDTLRDLARLRSIPPETLAIEGCALVPSEQLALRDVAVGHLILRDIPDAALELYRTKTRSSISIEGGQIALVSIFDSCPGGGYDCPDKERRLPPGLSISLSKTRVCRLELVDELTRKGLAITESRCDGYPIELQTLGRKIQSEWDSLVGGDLEANQKTGFDTLPDSVHLRYARNDTSLLEPEAIYHWDNCEESSFPAGYSTSDAAYGKDWFDNQAGSFRTGAGIRGSFAGKEFSAGMTREELVSLFGKPAIDQGRFLGWAVQGGCEPIMIPFRAHFDETGKLDAFWEIHDLSCGGC